MDDHVSRLVGLEGFEVKRVVEVGDRLDLEVELVARPGCCPRCGRTSVDVKERPVVRARDLPIAGRVTICCGASVATAARAAGARLASRSEADAASLLPPESGYLPRIAVVAGPDGLDLIRALVASAAPGTKVAVEHGPAQAEAVRRLLTDARTLADRTGVERVTLGTVA